MQGKSQFPGNGGNNEPYSDVSRVKDKAKQRRQLAGYSALNDQTLRTLYQSHDSTAITSSRMNGLSTRRQDATDAKVKDLMDKSDILQSQILDMSRMTERRIKDLKKDDSVWRPINDRQLSLLRPPADALEGEIRDEQDRLEEENLRLMAEKRSLIDSMRSGDLRASTPVMQTAEFKFNTMHKEIPPSSSRRQISAKVPPLRYAGGNGPSSYLKTDRLRELEAILRDNKNMMTSMTQEQEDLTRRLREKEQALISLPPAQTATFGGGIARGSKKEDDLRKLIQNAQRNPDLNDFERALTFVEAQEHDSIRLMMKVPVGTDLYRFKAEQFKETSTTRGEIEKLVYEQMLKSMKKGFDIESKEAERRSENLMWDDEQRKNIIAAYIRRQLGTGITMEYNSPYIPEDESEDVKVEVVRKPEKKKTYDPTEGFIVHWDYCLGLPQHQRHSAFEYQIVCQSDNVRDLEQSADIGNNVEDGESTCRVVFGQKNRIKGVPINPEMLMIWKVYMIANEGDREQMIEIGWTQIDLWTLARKLKRGRWKCPLYELRVDPDITKEGVQKLTPIPGIWFYLRISYPWQDEFNFGSLEPSESSELAEIPEIHLRALTWSKPPQQIVPVKEIVPEKATELKDNSPEREPQREPTPPMPKDEEYIPPDAKNKDKPDKEEIMIGQRVGVIVEVMKVQNHTAQSHMKVDISCRERGIKVKDDTLHKWERQTMIHNPFLGGQDIGEEFQAAIVESQLVKEGKMANLANNTDVQFKNQNFNLYRNLKAMLRNTNKHCYLIFQLLEKPRPKDVLRGKNKGFADDQMANLGGLQYNVVGIAIFQLSTEELNIKEGVFKIPFYKPTVTLPGDDKEEWREELCQPLDEGSFLHFRLTLKPYAEDDVRKEYQSFQVDRTAKKPLPTDEKMDLVKMLGNIVNNAAFIKNASPQYPKQITFERGYGFDFYLDQCRFLPDNVSITKCYIRVVNIDYEDVFPMIVCMPTKMTKDNDSFNPVFNFRQEFRSPFIDPTSMLFMAFVTIDRSNNKSRLIGYAAVNLFVGKSSEKQPESSEETDVLLRSGHYQLQLKCEEPLRIRPFNKARMNKLEDLPCASVLIRIRMAPLSDDLKTVLGKKDVPKDEWVSKGIWPARPEYNTGIYNSDDCRPREKELQLFPLRQQREPISLSQKALELKAKNGKKDEEMTAKDLFLFIDDLIEYTSKTHFLDGKFFAKYRPESGFDFVIDALHNIPNSNPYIVFYSLNPPGKYYHDSSNTEDLRIMAKLNWEHPIGQIKYFSEYEEYRALNYDPYKHIVIEVKEIEFTKEEVFIFKDYAWTIVPVFIGDGYVTNGHYQIPLFQGPYPKDTLLSSLTEKSSWSTLETMRKEKKIKWTLSYTSIIFRLRDGQRPGQLKKELDFKTLDFMYLPRNLDDKKLFAFNEQVKTEMETRKKLNKAVPEFRNPSDYNKEIEVACVEKYNLTNYRVNEAIE